MKLVSPVSTCVTGVNVDTGDAGVTGATGVNVDTRVTGVTGVSMYHWCHQFIKNIE